jgi:hypothetical protein
MQEKTLLLASFVDEKHIDFFLKKLYNNFNIKKNNIFFYKIEKSGELLLTYKIKVDFEKKINIKDILKKTTQVHKKNNTFFTINALNKLIEEKSGLQGNVNHKEYKVNWEEYDNKIIILKSNIVEIINLTKITF